MIETKGVLCKSWGFGSRKERIADYFANNNPKNSGKFQSVELIGLNLGCKFDQVRGFFEFRKNRRVAQILNEKDSHLEWDKL